MAKRNKKKKHSRLDKFYKVYGKYYAEPTIIMVPKTSIRIVKRMAKKKLKTIHDNPEIAREKIFLFLNEFYIGHLMFLKDELEFEAVDIHSKIIKDIFSYSKYTDAIELMYKEGILVRPSRNIYKVGGFSKAYMLENSMIYKEFVKYQIISKPLQKKQIELTKDQFEIIMKNPIARSSVLTSANILFPTEKELVAHAQNLIKKGWSNKGKKLAFQKDRKKNDKHIQKLIEQGVSQEDLPKYYYIETGMKLYRALVGNGLMLPRIGNYKSGYRVTTAFTLMPKWIRIALKIKNSTTVGVDFSALHPNIASTLWGNGTSITHTEVAEYLGIPTHTAKIQHLKFFNTTVTGMKKMVLYTYYKEKQPEMLEQVKETKKRTYKRTSSLMFKAEVEIMSKAISILEQMNLSDSIIYVYDEIMTTKEYAHKVQQAMIKASSSLGYNLKAKIG